MRYCQVSCRSAKIFPWVREEIWLLNPMSYHGYEKLYECYVCWILHGLTCGWWFPSIRITLVFEMWDTHITYNKVENHEVLLSIFCHSIKKCFQQIWVELMKTMEAIKKPKKQWPVLKTSSYKREARKEGNNMPLEEAVRRLENMDKGIPVLKSTIIMVGHYKLL